jgi:hypothetical protein
MFKITYLYVTLYGWYHTGTKCVGTHVDFYMHYDGFTQLRLLACFSRVYIISDA